MTLRILSGRWKGHLLASVKVQTTRPTTAQLRQAVYNIWSDKIIGAHVLDLFAGSGAMGFEALSLGAEHVTFVEDNLQAAKVIAQNAERLDCRDLVKLWSAKAEVFLKKNNQTFDLIFVDPPYDWCWQGSETTKVKATAPAPGQYVMNLAKALVSHLNPGGELIIEQAKHSREIVQGVENLEYVETRTYGDTHLHRFVRLA